MFELLGVIVGGIFRLAPTVLDLFHKGQDNTHELAMLDKQIELAKVNSENKRQEIADQTAADISRDAAAASNAVDVEYAKGLLEALKGQSSSTGVAWVDAFNASVRPALTYWWCIVTYTAAKIVYGVVAFQTHRPLSDFAGILLTDFDRQVVASIIGFWFVDRALRKLGR